MELIEPYQSRPIRFLELWIQSGWRVKVYGITYQHLLPRPELVAAAKEITRAYLSPAMVGNSHYSVGFLGVHDGRGSNFVFFDYWADENELHHHVYVSPSDQPQALQYVTPIGLIACVWDLRLMAFERQAWLDSVLANPTGPDLEAYLACRLNEDV